MGGEPLEFEKKQKVEGVGEVGVTRLDYLVTEFALLTPEGRALRAEGQAAFLSVGKGRTTFTLPDVPMGKYAGVAFRLGVSEAKAALDPTTWPAGHPLNPAVNGLHWGWQGGYVHLALEGRLGEVSFSYHLARAENLMTIRVEQPFEIAGDSTLGLRFEVARVLSGVQVRAGQVGATTHSAPGDALAARLRGNVSQAWSFAGFRAGGGAPSLVVPARVPAGATAYPFKVPNGFPPPELPADNPLTAEGVALGGKLFREVRLSVNDGQSCASCHQPERGFTESRAVSAGATGPAGVRNAPTLLNLAWHGRFAWDGRRERLREAALVPISDLREMGQPLEQAVAKLAADPAYAAEFAKAFGVPPAGAVTAERVGLALEQFLLTRTGATSKFDRMLRGEAKLTEEETQGLVLFNTEFDPARGQRGADCFHCHGGFDFSDHGFHDTGLGGPDGGRMNATGREEDRGKFKTPTLRNVANSAPYFHDGRAATLEEVVAHYDHGILRTANLDPNLAKRGALDLKPEEQRALLAFLRTLSEEPAQGAGK